MSSNIIKVKRSSMAKKHNKVVSGTLQVIARCRCFTSPRHLQALCPRPWSGLVN